VVSALLVVVAIVAHGRPLGAHGNTGGGLPSAFWDYAFTALLILEVGVLVGVVVAVFTLRQYWGSTRSSYYARTTRALIYMFAMLAILLAVASRLHVHRLHPAAPSIPTTQGAKTPQHRRVRFTGHPHFRWDEFGIVLGLLAILGASVVAARRRRGSPTERSRVPRRALAAALDESLDDLRDDPDLRRAIIAAYARMETALAAAGLARRPSEAPLEYLERALLSLDTSSSAIRRLTDLFEWARFSQHEPEPSMRDEAVDALVSVRDELRASELVAA
jgi:hypothetical protein